MAYTVRTTPEEDGYIETAKKCLGTASASRAMIEACWKLPKLKEKLEDEQRKNRNLEMELRMLKQVVRRKLEADDALLNAISF